MTLEQLSPPPVSIPSRYFGFVTRDASSEIHLPFGIPGFESENSLIAIEIPEQRPLVYLQSASNPDLCFLTLPAASIDENFKIELSEDERAALLLGSDESLVPGENVMALSILFPADDRIQVNLAAPLIINLCKMVAIQCLPDSMDEARRLELRNSGEWIPLC